jgi:hypothetical protein
MRDAVYEAKNDTHVLKIYGDGDCGGPRHDTDCNVAVMFCLHKRYELGDKREHNTPESFDEYLKENKDEVVLLQPLYLMDHSGLSISIGASRFAACDPQGWDWGKLGYVYTTKTLIRQQLGVKLVTKKVLEQVQKQIEAEVAEYDQFLQEGAFGYVFKKRFPVDEEDEEKSTDSCFGFYGTDWAEAMVDQAPNEARPLFEKLGFIKVPATPAKGEEHAQVQSAG